MMDNDLDLPALRAFRAVVREGSFSAAALTLRTPKSTLSKRVADLEANLKVRLIERTTRRIRVTAEGEVLAARVDRLLGEADDIRRAMGEQGGAPRGHLRIAVPQVMGNVMFGRIGARFRALHPDITLEVHFLERSPDLLEEGFDSCIRFGPMEDTAQVARLLLHGHAVLVAHPDLPGLQDLASPDQLMQMPLVGLASAWNGGWPLVCGTQSIKIAARPALMLGSYLAVRDAVMEQAGIALMPYLLAQPDLVTGRLTQVLPEWESPRKGLYFVYPSAQSVTARLRVFLDFLIAECAMAVNVTA
jgi:DNA-binding transcriptional LysR family regulator